MADRRSRIVINKPRKLVLMANFKCGFSAINQVISEEDGFSVAIKNGRELKPWLKDNDFSSYRSVFISRNPYDRLLSFYFNWLVDKEETYERPSDGEKIDNWAFSNLKELMILEDYQDFAGLSASKRGTPEAFSSFIQHLPDYYMMNPHTHPQHLLYSMAGLSIDQFAEQVDIENLSAMLSGLFGTEIPTANPSSNKPRYRNEFFSSEAATIFNELYSRDLSDLGYEELG